MRLWFATMAYVLLEGLRRIGLKATKLANSASARTIELVRNTPLDAPGSPHA